MGFQERLASAALLFRRGSSTPAKRRSGRPQAAGLDAGLHERASAQEAQRRTPGDDRVAAQPMKTDPHRERSGGDPSPPPLCLLDSVAIVSAALSSSESQDFAELFEPRASRFGAPARSRERRLRALMALRERCEAARGRGPPPKDIPAWAKARLPARLSMSTDALVLLPEGPRAAVDAALHAQPDDQVERGFGCWSNPLAWTEG